MNIGKIVETPKFGDLLKPVSVLATSFFSNSEA